MTVVWLGLLLAMQSAAPPDPQQEYFKALSAMQAGDRAKAKAGLESVVKTKPDFAPARILLVSLELDAGRLPSAIRQLEAMSALPLADPEMIYQLGRAYQRVAAEASARLSTAKPNQARMHQFLAENYATQGKREEAMRSYRAALAADPKLAGSHLGIAILFMQGEQGAEAISELEEELKVAPESAVAKELKRRLEAQRR
jgi:predicted Zn-dependent protease